MIQDFFGRPFASIHGALDTSRPHQAKEANLVRNTPGQSWSTAGHLRLTYYDSDIDQLAGSFSGKVQDVIDGGRQLGPISIGDGANARRRISGTQGQTVRRQLSQPSGFLITARQTHPQRTYFWSCQLKNSQSQRFSKAGLSCSESQTNPSARHTRSNSISTPLMSSTRE